MPPIDVVASGMDLNLDLDLNSKAPKPKNQEPGTGDSTFQEKIMAFKDTRRQRFLNEAQVKAFGEILQDRVARSGKKMYDESLVAAARSSYAWLSASSSLELLILRYTAGQPVNELSNALPAVIAAFDSFIPLDIPQTPNEAHTHSDDWLPDPESFPQSPSWLG